MASPASTAFIVCDLQNDVAHPDSEGVNHGPLAESWKARISEIQRKHVLENTRAVLDRVRETAVMVIHVAIQWRPGYPELGTGFQIFDQVKAFGGFVEGTWGAAFHEMVAPVDGEIVIAKRRLSAFYGSDLEMILRMNNITTTVIAGAATVFVVEATAREAADRGFEVVVLEDCVANFDKEEDDFLLQRVLPKFGEVMPSARFLEERL